MDLFSKNKLLFWAVIILAVLNFALLGTFWYTHSFRYKPPNFPMSQNMGPERFHFKEFIKNELNLSDDQMKQYQDMLDDHFKKSRDIMEQIHNQRKALFDEVFSQNPDSNKINNITGEIGKLQADFEKASVAHFEQVKTLIKPDQYDKLKGILDEVMINQRPMRDGFPHGEALHEGRPRFEEKEWKRDH
jgi:Spy/CpxP family protein refolding chaperone